jgi:diaminohydroxyphosphoribosylaminopyrimidine deaminase/5-amino-6-(5-phosphoribosylamino)uracil reductase
MEELARRGLMSVLLEGGPTLNASALKEGLVDHLLFFFAPKVVGGERAPAMIGGEGALWVQEAQPVRILKIRRIGPDVLIEGTLRQGE